MVLVLEEKEVVVLDEKKLEDIDGAPEMKGQIVCAAVMPFRITEKLWVLVWTEFEKNGRKTLAPGKLRFLRRKARRISLRR